MNSQFILGLKLALAAIGFITAFLGICFAIDLVLRKKQLSQAYLHHRFFDICSNPVAQTIVAGCARYLFWILPAIYYLFGAIGKLLRWSFIAVVVGVGIYIFSPVPMILHEHISGQFILGVAVAGALVGIMFVPFIIWRYKSIGFIKVTSRALLAIPGSAIVSIYLVVSLIAGASG
jgi:hypothetical protein